MKDDYYYQFSLFLLYIYLLEGWENVLFELGSERVEHNLYTDDATNYSFPFSSPESKPENLTIHYT